MVFKFILFLTATLAFYPSAVSACLGPPSHTQTFLSTLPNNADEKPIVAKIKILSKTEKGSSFEYDVEIITGLKGIKKGKTITVSVLNHTCQHADMGKVGDIYFIAGEMKNINPSKGRFKRMFEGEWKSWDLMQEQKTVSQD